ncbi:MAG: hypothetical protein NAG76_19065 [Candidatus Pristimantibacillus lignocellulolyticus]|uniref:Uncharacterized protein n=1 Tax=Candidatus Pristimantibacillus lignocellulolyticus TaxID=2994561 RepID=A0A9J6ZDB2_9BACL|nr:MAG: hypothetical protein NAG76_19065 [Candidatus Pristimantibacillus lignocellulolyticus]
MGFQNRAGEALLEQGGSANVRGWYMRTVLAKFASDAMSSNPRSIPIVIKARILNYHL